MIINKIVLDNVGVFYGKHEFLLNSANNHKKQKPIILFGGMNGSGKTTLFEAIKLCLYGENVLEEKRNGNYKTFLSNKIHQSKNLFVQPNYASIQLEFQYAKMGVLDTFLIERQWENDRGKIIEILNVRKNGKELDEIEKDNWQEFLKELIPMGLSQLFFFDGEKIQKMMSDDNNHEFKKSIKALLGLDLVERLKADLKIYRTKNLMKISDNKFSQDLESIEKGLRHADSEKRKIKDKLAQINDKLEKNKSKIEDYESKVAAQGGSYFDNRTKFLDKKSLLEGDIELIKNKFREICSDLLPASIASKRIIKLKDQIIKESEFANNKVASELLSKKTKSLLNKIKSKSFLKNVISINAVDLRKVKKHLEDEVRSILEDYSSKTDVQIIYGISQQQTTSMLSDIDEALSIVPKEIKNLTKKYEAKFRELQNIQINLERVPNDQFLKPMHEKLVQLYKNDGALENKFVELTEVLKKIDNDKNELQRKKQTIENKYGEINKADKKLMLVKKSEKVIHSFHKELSRLKSIDLTNEFSKVFNSLHRKKDMINRIDINPESFDVTLFDTNNKTIDKNRLSSGELEIYAMSMVWGLAKVSRQNLPFVIDTPLGRLDSKHRNNILTHFFPNASHQMLIFSTDTEVDRNNFGLLKPFISAAYHLEHHDQDKSTKVKKGYFWN